MDVVDETEALQRFFEGKKSHLATTIIYNITQNNVEYYLLYTMLIGLKASPSFISRYSYEHIL